MLLKTQGIIIRNTKYSESSIISKIFTKNLGMQTYIINGIHAPKAAIKPSLLLPLSVLDLVAYNKPGAEIQRIKEAKPFITLKHLHFDLAKSGIALFISEIINRTIKEQEPNENLYLFLENIIRYLDEKENKAGLVPLFFLIHYSRFLGFYPQDNFLERANIFNMQEGGFVQADLPENISIPLPYSAQLSALIQTDFEHLSSLQIDKAGRAYLLDKMLEYYSLHLPVFGGVKSVEVLREVMG
ncbi:MAG: DNA repair protein RecO [Bacteroidetes bacterium]|nr:DNA repair protein RecO [Bacteroidota bacterium]